MFYYDHITRPCFPRIAIAHTEHKNSTMSLTGVPYLILDLRKRSYEIIPLVALGVASANSQVMVRLGGGGCIYFL